MVLILISFGFYIVHEYSTRMNSIIKNT